MCWFNNLYGYLDVAVSMRRWLKNHCGLASLGGRMMAEDATPLVEAILTIIEAARAYLPPDGFDKDEFITRVL